MAGLTCPHVRGSYRGRMSILLVRPGASTQQRQPLAPSRASPSQRCWGDVGQPDADDLPDRRLGQLEIGDTDERWYFYGICRVGGS